MHTNQLSLLDFANYHSGTLTYGKKYISVVHQVEYETSCVPDASTHDSADDTFSRRTRQPALVPIMYLPRPHHLGRVQGTMSFRTPSSPGKSLTSDPHSDSDSVNSLFDAPSTVSIPVAMRRAPPIPGLFVPQVLLPPELAEQIASECMRLYFDDGDVNQIMLFGRTAATADEEEEDMGARMGKGLPSILIQLLCQLSALLQPWIPADLHDYLFPSKGAPPRARQAILNLYRPGEGIASHVDLLNRFDDGIIGISLCGGCVMSFEEVEHAAQGFGKRGGEGEEKWDLYLPERSVLVMSKDARYYWKHGIPGRTHDLVENEDQCHEPCLIKRGVRLSVTFRWLLPGADIVGGPEPRILG